MQNYNLFLLFPFHMAMHRTLGVVTFLVLGRRSVVLSSYNSELLKSPFMVLPGPGLTTLITVPVEVTLQPRRRLT